MYVHVYVSLYSLSTLCVYTLFVFIQVGFYYNMRVRLFCSCLCLFAVCMHTCHYTWYMYSVCTILFSLLIELAEDCIINWSSEVVGELGSKLHPLWNRTAGDCLLDSVLQATWGVMDREATLRRAMADSLTDGASRYVYMWESACSLWFILLLSICIYLSTYT